MARILSLLPALLLSSAVSAQVSSGMATKGAFGVFANKKAHAVKDATPIKSVLRLSASDMKGRTILARASSYVSHRSSTSMTRGSYAYMSDSAYALGGNKAGTSKPHSVALTLRAKTVVRGTVRLSYFGRKTGVGSGGASVVFGSTKWFARADGKRHTLEVKGVLVAPKVLGILISTNAMADASKTRSPASASGALSVSFIPDRDGFKVSITMGKASCREGGKFTGTVRNTGRTALISFKLQGSLKQAFAFLVLSPSDSFFPLPGSKCIFFKAPMVFSMTRTDTRGNASVGLRIDAHQVRASSKVPAQMLTAGLVRGGIQIVTSNSLNIIITK